MPDKTKAKRGGARPNSGRPRVDPDKKHRPLSLSLPGDAARWIEDGRKKDAVAALLRWVKREQKKTR